MWQGHLGRLFDFDVFQIRLHLRWCLQQVFALLKRTTLVQSQIRHARGDRASRHRVLLYELQKLQMVAQVSHGRIVKHLLFNVFARLLVRLLRHILQLIE